LGKSGNGVGENGEDFKRRLEEAEIEKEKLVIQVKSLNIQVAQLKQENFEIQLALSDLSPTRIVGMGIKGNYEQGVLQMKEAIGHLEVCLEDLSLENIRLNTILAVKEREIENLKSMTSYTSYLIPPGSDAEELKKLKADFLASQEQVAKLSAETNRLQVDLLREQQVNKGLRSDLEASEVTIGQFQRQTEQALKENGGPKSKGSQGERVKNICMTKVQSQTTLKPLPNGLASNPSPSM
jgi:predicted  nucleic acid-binding Zn-ribbon protein